MKNAEVIKLPTTEEEWLAARLKGIGASEASAIVGCNPYMSNVDLWKIKTGRKTAPDISNKDCVQYGHAAEAPLREMFALDYPQYEVSYGGAFDMVHHPEYPWLFATLDGRLKEMDNSEPYRLYTGRCGVLEIKTTEILKSMQKEKWQTLDGKPRLPDNYYIQNLHQLLATGWHFVVLHAQLKRIWDGDIKTERRTYFIERADVQADLDYLLEKEIEFWECVEQDRQPNLLLPEI